MQGIGSNLLPIADIGERGDCEYRSFPSTSNGLGFVKSVLVLFAVCQT